MPLTPVGIFSAYTLITPSGYGYWAGGYQTNTSPQEIRSLDKFDFNLETISTTGLILNATAYFNTGVSNIGTAGYLSKGRGGSVATLDKLLYSNDSISVTSGTLSGGAAYGFATISDQSVAGYYVGGTGSTRVSTTVDKVTYSNDNISTTTSLSQGNYYWGGMSNFGVAGYIPQVTTSIYHKYSFPSDTPSTLSIASSLHAYYAAYFSNDKVAGYQVGGGSTAIVSIRKFSFTSQTTYTLSAQLSTARNEFAGISHTQVAGYVSGGTTTYLNSIEKLTFNSDTQSVISATLSKGRYQHAGLSNGGIV